jgi:hypothetical protein
MILLIHQYSHYDTHIDTATSEIIMFLLAQQHHAMTLLMQQSSISDTYIDTAICHITILLLIHQSFSYDSLDTAILQLR